MQAILENSGAQNAALILESPQGPIVEARLKAQNTRESEYDINVQSIPLSNATDLPISLIAYVLRTKTEQVLQSDSDQWSSKSTTANNNISTYSYASEAFIADPYLQIQQPKSVLCIPVTYRDKLLGALYLDNKLIDRAFPQERFDIIKMLLAQAAISFENARLFEEVTELNTELEQKVDQRTDELKQAVKELNSSNKELEVANKELEAFSYSVSHDLRSPLRTMKGYSNIILEDHLDGLDSEVVFLLKKISQGGEKMFELINGLLDLSRVQRQELVRQQVSLSEIASIVMTDIQLQDTQRQAKVEIEEGMEVSGDERMLFSVIENLLGNAWKYSSKTALSEITFASKKQNNQRVYYVQDNGAGFEMAHVDKLFGTFQRLHKEKDFAGTGVGLSTVKRVIEKHGGTIWAEAKEGKGATFYFTLK